MKNNYYVYAYLNPDRPCKLELDGISFLYEPFYICLLYTSDAADE